MIVFTFRYAIKINDASTFPQKRFQVVRPQASVSKSEVKCQAIDMIIIITFFNFLEIKLITIKIVLQLASL